MKTTVHVSYTISEEGTPRVMISGDCEVEFVDGKWFVTGHGSFEGLTSVSEWRSVAIAGMIHLWASP